MFLQDKLVNKSDYSIEGNDSTARENPVVFPQRGVEGHVVLVTRIIWGTSHQATASTWPTYTDFPVAY